MKLIELLALERMGINVGSSKHQNSEGYICNVMGELLSLRKYPLCEDWRHASVTRPELELFKCRGYKVVGDHCNYSIEDLVKIGWSFEQLKQQGHIEVVNVFSQLFDEIPKIENCRCQITPIELPNSIALESVPQHPFTFRHKSAEVTFTDFKDLRDLIEVILK